MEQDYISFIRSKVGTDKIFLNFAAGILKDGDGQILLQRRTDKDSWGLIGGMMELGESSIDTLKREFLEESGLMVEAKRLLNVYTNFETVYASGDRAQTIGFLYEVEATMPLAITSFQNEETAALAFFQLQDIEHLTLFNHQTEVMISDYIAGNFPMGR